MKLVSLENLLKYNELLNQKTVRSVNSIKPDSTGNVQLGTAQTVDAQHNFSKNVMTNKVLMAVVWYDYT